MTSLFQILGLFAIGITSVGSPIENFEYNKYNEDFTYITKLTASCVFPANNNVGSHGDIQCNVAMDMTLSYANQDYYGLFIKSVYCQVLTSGSFTQFQVPRYTFDTPIQIVGDGVLDKDLIVSLNVAYDGEIDYYVNLTLGESTIKSYHVANLDNYGEYYATEMAIKYDKTQIDNIIMQYLDSNETGAYRNGFEDGELVGFDKGYQAGLDDSDNFSISALMFSIFNAPVAILGGALNFTIFGVNIKNLVFFILTIGIIMWIISVFKGGK